MIQNNRLYWLDYARFLAASAVMLFHYLANGPRKGVTGSMEGYGTVASIFEYGYLGVDLFFIISGFVILNSSLGRRADQFAVSRATKLWPTFALCVSITSLAIIFLNHQAITPLRFLGNLTMVPGWINIDAIDGVYWTIAYELAFYFCVFLLIIFGLLKYIRWILPIWVGMICLARLFDFGLPPLGLYFELFAAGCALALIHRLGWKLDLILAFSVCIALSFIGAEFRAVRMIDRGVIPALSGTLVVVGLLCFMCMLNFKMKLPAASVIGDLTYPLYLLHAQIGYSILSNLSGNKWIAAFSVSLFSIALALAVVLGFERPTKILRKNFFEKILGTPIRKLLRIRKDSKVVS